VTGFTVVYGVSNNDRVTVDNSNASFLGYRPKDNAEEHAERMFAEAGVLDNQDPGNMCQGGPFASVKLGNSGVATMNIVDDTKKT
jgi:uronate dehydrogenase